MESTCKKISEYFPPACKPALARKISLKGLTPIKQEIEYTSKGTKTTLKPTRNVGYTEAAMKFATRVFEIAQAANVTKDGELFLLFPLTIDYNRYRSGLCGGERLVRPGETVSYRKLLIDANFARPTEVLNPTAAGRRNRFPHPKFTAAMFTKRRAELSNALDVSGEVLCKKPQGGLHFETFST